MRSWVDAARSGDIDASATVLGAVLFALVLVGLFALVALAIGSGNWWVLVASWDGFR
jgi:hypothetical protein